MRFRRFFIKIPMRMRSLTIEYLITQLSISKLFGDKVDKDVVDKLEFIGEWFCGERYCDFGFKWKWKIYAYTCIGEKT